MADKKLRFSIPFSPIIPNIPYFQIPSICLFWLIFFTPISTVSGQIVNDLQKNSTSQLAIDNGSMPDITTPFPPPSWGSLNKSLTSPTNDFQLESNPHYWKNKKPYEGYWQQDVYYQIKATLNDTQELINGSEKLTYTNNSPNTLHQAFFHLYQNAVQPGSLVDELYRINKTKVAYGQYEAQQLGTIVHSVVINGQSVPFSIQNTLLKINLPQPLKSGESIDFYIDFTTYFDRGSVRRRMKVYDHHGYKHFNGVHWYPRICVYDRKFTWETDQHVEKEFYGDYGAFDVELDLPNHYIVEATGLLQNKDEAMPMALRRQIDISNFKETPIGSQPSVIIPATGKRKRWQFHANNVHDFAWTADPTYRLGEVDWNGIKCVAIVQENNAAGWQQTAQFTAKVIATYSRDFGMYDYPKIVCADAADGMEYPMITMDGGHYPSHQSLIAHEVGHNWFFGMIGSNETYRAALDEGFTQFLTAWCMRKLTKENQPELKRAFSGYMEDAIDGTDESLETHSNEFHSATGHGGGYKHVYYKTASMLYNLQYTLGDSVFLEAMKDYVSQWKFCHPYIDDFRNSITQSAQTDLNTFFDQWFISTKAADYGIKKITALRPQSNRYRVTIARNGDMVMPVDMDFLIRPNNAPKTANTSKKSKAILASDVFYSITIPVNQYQKPGRYNLRPWIGWDRLRRTYTFDIDMPVEGELRQVWLDRSGRLADINRTDNVWKNRNEWRWDLGNGANTSYLGVYQWKGRPDIRINGANGVLFGGIIDGQYAGRKKQFELGAWAKTGIGAKYSNPTININYRMSFTHQTRGAGTYFFKSLLYNEINSHEMGWFDQAGKTTYGISGKMGRRYQNQLNSQNRNNSLYNPWDSNGVLTGKDPYFPQRSALNGYLPTANCWSYLSNIHLDLFVQQAYAGWGRSGNIRCDVRLSSPWSETQYGYIQMEWKHYQPIGKTNLRIRSIAYFGGGSNPTPESVLYVANANPEESFNNAIYRDFGMINWRANQPGQSNPIWTNTNAINQSIQVNGGLNLRGFDNYSIPKSVKQANGTDTVLAFFRGNQGAAINANWDFSTLFDWVPKIKMVAINPYLFGDAGCIGMPLTSKNSMGNIITKSVNSGLLADAGLGVNLNLKNFNILLKNKAMRGSKPLNIKVDFPIWRNAIQPNDTFLKFRMRLSVGTVF
jgi:aminopeptidase N